MRKAEGQGAPIVQEGQNLGSPRWCEELTGPFLKPSRARREQVAQSGEPACPTQQLRGGTRMSRWHPGHLANQLTG